MVGTRFSPLSLGDLSFLWCLFLGFFYGGRVRCLCAVFILYRLYEGWFVSNVAIVGWCFLWYVYAVVTCVYRYVFVFFRCLYLVFYRFYVFP